MPVVNFPVLALWALCLGACPAVATSVVSSADGGAPRALQLLSPSSVQPMVACLAQLLGCSLGVRSFAVSCLRLPSPSSAPLMVACFAQGLSRVRLFSSAVASSVASSAGGGALRAASEAVLGCAAGALVAQSVVGSADGGVLRTPAAGLLSPSSFRGLVAFFARQRVSSPVL